MIIYIIFYGWTDQKVKLLRTGLFENIVLPRKSKKLTTGQRHFFWPLVNLHRPLPTAGTDDTEKLQTVEHWLHFEKMDMTEQDIFLPNYRGGASVRTQSS